MTTPNQNELTYYVNKRLDDTDWKNNFNQVLAWITDGTYDLTINSLTTSTLNVTGTLSFSGSITITGTITCARLNTVQVRAQDVNGLGLYNSAGAGAKITDGGNLEFTTATLKANFWNYITATGSIHTFANAIPAGYHLLECAGTAVSRTTYSELFALIGITHGQGDGSLTFNLPDYRGRFLRGVDGGATNDPDSAARTAMNTGGNTGDNIGSIQADAMQGHYHSFFADTTANVFSPIAVGGADGSDAHTVRGGSGGLVYNLYMYSPITDGTNGTPRTSSESRSKNAYVKYYIKY
jgi:microcystin-dependent protein